MPIQKLESETAFKERWNDLKKLGTQGHTLIVVTNDGKTIKTAARISIGKRFINFIRWLFCCGGNEQHERIAKIADAHTFFALNQQYFKLKHVSSVGFERIIEYFSNDSVLKDRLIGIGNNVLKDVSDKIKDSEAKNKELKIKIKQVNNETADQLSTEPDKYKKQIDQAIIEADQLQIQIKTLENDVLSSRAEIVECEDKIKKNKDALSEIAKLIDAIKDQKIEVEQFQETEDQFISKQEELNKIKENIRLLELEKQKQQGELQFASCPNSVNFLNRMMQMQKEKSKKVNALMQATQALLQSRLNNARANEEKLFKDAKVVKGEQLLLKAKVRELSEKIQEKEEKYSTLFHKEAALKSEVNALKSSVIKSDQTLLIVCSDGIFEGKLSLIKDIPLLATIPPIMLKEGDVSNPAIHLRDLGLQCTVETLKLYFYFVKNGLDLVKTVKSVNILLRLYSIAHFLCCNEEDKFPTLIYEAISKLAKEKGTENQIYKNFFKFQIPAESALARNLYKSRVK